MKRLRIFLCQSYLGDAKDIPLVFPIGLAYLASLINDDHEIYCWDPNVDDNPSKEFPRLLEKISPDIVGISFRNVDSALSFMSYWFYPAFVSMLKTTKKIAPQCKLVVGGGGFSLFAEEIMLRHPEIDFGIITDGERPFAQLLQNLDHPERVNNLVFRKHGQIHFTERSNEDFESLPSPSSELFEINKYKNQKFALSVQSKRGCSFKCIFCPNMYLAGCKYKLRSPKSVVDEIEHLVDAYDVDSYFFVDSTFNYPFEYSRKICQELIRRKLETTWLADMTPASVNERFMREALQSGCEHFNFSPDGASDNALAFLGKNIMLEHINKTISLVSKIEGAKVSYGFMYDIPRHNSEHVAGLTRLIPKMLLKLRDKLSFISLTRMRIYPHTQLHALAVREGKVDPKDDILYPVYYSAASSLSMGSIITRAIETSLLLRINAQNASTLLGNKLRHLL